MAFQLIVVGASTGGLDALRTLLSRLPKGFPTALAIVQHRSPNEEALLAQLLQKSSALSITEAEDMEKITPGHVFLAPAGYHLLVERARFALSTEAPVNCSRPSVDVLFESAAEAYGREVLGVILTGASADGAQGVRRIKDRGGSVVVQRPDQAESDVMPAAAIASTSVDRVMTLDEIAHYLIQHCPL